jgi:hypothetical protein
MIKLKDLLIEGKITEDYKNSKWEVYVGDDPYGKNRKVVKVAKSKRAATILYNKLIKTDKYFEVGMRAVMEGKLTEKKKTIPFKDVPSYMKDHYPTQKHWDYYQSLPDGKKWMYYKKYPNILAKQSKKTDDFIAQQKKELGLEGKLSEMNEPWFEITYKDSRGRKKTDSMRAKNPKEAKKDFVNLMKGRGFKVLKVVKEGKLSEKKFIPTVTIEKYGKEISVEKFKTTNDAKKYTKQMIKKYKLKWVKGFWGNPKTGIELTQNFS